MRGPRHPLTSVTRSRLNNFPGAMVVLLVALLIVAPMPRPSLSFPPLGLEEFGGFGRSGVDSSAVPTSVVSRSAQGASKAMAASGARLPRLLAQATPPPNEIGGIPILMYHAFTLDPDEVDDWTMTLEDFRMQLEWLRANDFVMVGMQTMLDGRFDVPAGKRPVILTFDDSSAGQFGLLESDGEMAVNPDTAVGVLEAYGELYPDFTGPAFFAVLPFNCFASPGDHSTCEERLTWLYKHGYEIGNHTSDHDILVDVSPEFFTRTIGSMQVWMNERLPAGPGNLSNVLVLPLGGYPDPDLHEDQRSWLSEGFWYLGEPVELALVLEISGGPANPPYATSFSPIETFRINAEPALFDYWKNRIETTDNPLFVSDGKPTVVSVPEEAVDEVDVERLKSYGLELELVDSGGKPDK